MAPGETRPATGTESMSRKGLVVALLIAAAGGLLFGLFPELDLAAARVFFRQGRFALDSDGFADAARNGARLVITLLAAPAIVAPLLKIALPQARMLVPGRAVVFLIGTLILGPGLMANTGLKDNWGRPRPHDVTEFGGPSQFRPWWDPRGTCPNNCSFVGGEPAGAFWTFAPAALAPPQWRPVAYVGALGFGVAVGLLRMAAGGHFASDVLFAGVFTFLIVWAVHALLYRWPGAGGLDRAVEGAFEIAGRRLRSGLASIGRALGRPSRGTPAPRP